MGKLIATSNCPFDLTPWQDMDIESVHAGVGAVMAITTTGHALQMTTNIATSYQSWYWHNIRSLSMSKVIPGAAIGLHQDGTCVLTQNPIQLDLSRHWDSHPYFMKSWFGSVIHQVHEWRDIVQVEMADAIFALDRNGRVHHACLPYPYEEKDWFKEADSWRDIVRIATGPQNALFGITSDGRVMATGGNPENNGLKGALATFSDVTDLCVTGAESNHAYLLKKDGKVYNDRGEVEELPPVGGDRYPVFGSHFNYLVLVRARNGKLFPLDCNKDWLAEVRDWPPVRTFSMGYTDIYGSPFVVAITE